MGQRLSLHAIAAGCLLAFSAAFVTTASARDVAAEIAAAQERFSAGELNGALRHLEPLLVTNDLDQATTQHVHELAARILHSRGEDNFRRARIADSVADFERQIQLCPDQDAEQWQLGIAYYYAGKYDKGARQFELHKTVNPEDVENAAWHFLCVARAAKGSAEAARKSLIHVTRDSRVPMAQIQLLLDDKIAPEEVLQTAKAANSAAKFYADLYVGLYYEALGKADESLRLMTEAAKNPAASDSYMGDVARVHVTLRKKADADRRPRQPEGSK